jgi:hypothetical protein
MENPEGVWSSRITRKRINIDLIDIIERDSRATMLPAMTHREKIII